MNRMRDLGSTGSNGLKGAQINQDRLDVRRWRFFFDYSGNLS